MGKLKPDHFLGCWITQANIFHTGAAENHLEVMPRQVGCEDFKLSLPDLTANTGLKCLPVSCLLVANSPNAETSQLFLSGVSQLLCHQFKTSTSDFDSEAFACD